MSTIGLSLPDPMQDWVEARAKAERFDEANAHLGDLVQQERGCAMAELQGLIDDGIRSGICDLTMDRVMEDARRQAAMLCRS